MIVPFDDLELVYQKVEKLEPPNTRKFPRVNAQDSKLGPPHTTLGRRRFFKAGPRSFAAAQIIFGIVLSLFCGVGPSAISEIFPTHNRSTLMSTGYAISVAIFGGFAPFIATWLILVTGIPIAPVFYVMAAAVVSAVVIWRMPETANEPLR